MNEEVMDVIPEYTDQERDLILATSAPDAVAYIETLEQVIRLAMRSWRDNGNKEKSNDLYDALIRLRGLNWLDNTWKQRWDAE